VLKYYDEKGNRKEERMEAYSIDSSILSVEPGNEVWYLTVNVVKHYGPTVRD
jgi:hypothetical protein